MKRGVFSFSLLIMTMLAGTALGGEVAVLDAKVTGIKAHGSYFDTETLIVSFDKTGSGCDKMWINTETKQADRAFEMIMAAYLHGKSVDYAMDPESPWPGAKELICEMRYIRLKQKSKKEECNRIRGALPPVRLFFALQFFVLYFLWMRLY